MYDMNGMGNILKQIAEEHNLYVEIAKYLAKYIKEHCFEFYICDSMSEKVCTSYDGSGCVQCIIDYAKREVLKK